MKAPGLAFLVLMAVSAARATDPIPFGRYFIDSTLRVDIFHAGNASEQSFTLDRIYRQGSWAGNPHHLIDRFGYGHYTVKLFDTSGTTLLYARGFDSYFDEYKTTAVAARGVKRTYHESLLVPCPRQPVLLVVEEKDRANVFHPVYREQIDPSDYHIVREKPAAGDTVLVAARSGDPHAKLDLVFIAEGYTADELKTFRKDLEQFAGFLLGMEPYRSHRNDVNISGVFRASQESGTDEPREGVYRNTVVSSSFNALDTDRYLLTEDNRTVRDIASSVPYDILCIMVNSPRYGGGGLYNDYTIFTAHNTYSETVFLHEFGHGFAGLGDEYYSGDVSYVDFYPRGVEPAEPNLTALLGPEGPKWKNLLTPGVAVPTEWGKAEYDSLQQAMGVLGREMHEHLVKLRGAGASKGAVDSVRAGYSARFSSMTRRVHEILVNPSLAGMVGACEGAGYTFRGLYRPSVNCMMFSNEERRLCPVCQDAVSRMISHFTE